MTVTIRHATPQDAADLAAVHVASWRVAYRDDAPPGWLDAQTVEARTESWVTRLTAVPPPLVLVALDPGDTQDTGDAQDTGDTRDTVISGDTVIGFSGVAIPSRDADADSDTAEIATFYVDPAHWRRGAGRSLMDATLADLSAAGFAAATLWVLETNARAQAFYAASGFAADGGRQTAGPGWPPEIRMGRGLGLG